MATKNLYFRSSANGVPVTGNWTLSETIGSSEDATSTHTGWTTNGFSGLIKPGASNSTGASGLPPTDVPPVSGNQFGWFTDTFYQGSFDPGAWTFQYRHDDNVGGAVGNAVINVYACTSQNFSGTFRFLFQFADSGHDWWDNSVGETVSGTTAAQPLIVLNKEWLFVQVWCNESTATSGGAHHLHVEVPTDGNATKLVTTNFTQHGSVLNHQQYRNRTA
jgi:hypothetical protein